MICDSQRGNNSLARFNVWPTSDLEGREFFLFAVYTIFLGGRPRDSKGVCEDDISDSNLSGPQPDVTRWKNGQH
jgi:hypothetical protein